MASAFVQVIGNLGSDPELRYTPTQKSVCSFSVAVNHSKPDGNGGWTDLGTDWYRVAVFGDRGERLAESLHKGSKVFVMGRLKLREWESDGRHGASLDVVADNVTDLTPRQSNGEREHAFAGTTSRQPSAPANTDLDDLPF